MSNTSFRTALEDRLTAVVRQAVGPGTDPVNFVKTFDDHIHDVAVVDMPFVIVTVRQLEEVKPGEMGTVHELHTWEGYVYYIDIEQADYRTGKLRRDFICNGIETIIELNPRLWNLDQASSQLVDIPLTANLPQGAPTSEYVYDTNFTNIIYDASGQEDYWTFATEMYLAIDTARR